MVTACSFGLTVESTKATGRRDFNKVKASINVQLEFILRENG